MVLPLAALPPGFRIVDRNEYVKSLLQRIDRAQMELDFMLSDTVIADQLVYGVWRWWETADVIHRFINDDGA